MTIGGLKYRCVGRVREYETRRAGAPSDLDLPGYRLHSLRGALKGYWSISISGNWRLTFRFEDGDAYDVDLVDYH